MCIERDIKSKGWKQRLRKYLDEQVRAVFFSLCVGDSLLKRLLFLRAEYRILLA
jgi:hypothetical protein